MAGAVAGGLIAGLGITAMLMAGERRSGAPSELATLERTGAAKLGLETPAPDILPAPGEQTLIQAGHLLLSAGAAAVYAAASREEARVVPSGLAFGLAFYAAAHWVFGPLLGLKPPEWQGDGKTIGMHAANHLAFGLATAAGTRLAAKV